MVKRDKETNTCQVNLNSGKENADVVAHSSNPEIGSMTAVSSKTASVPHQPGIQYETQFRNTKELQGDGDWCILGLSG